MENGTQKRHAATPGIIFWTLTTTLFALSVALRWLRLDLMTFQYDQTSVAFRAMEAFHGQFPLTGIINSLGFHNAPGYIWTVLPGFLVSPDPRWATAWHGLLASTMIFPLALLGRRHRSDALLWLPAIFAALLPASVFAGRSLWAQFLLPPVAAWALLALDIALDPHTTCKSRRRAAGASLAILAWGVSIHFSAAPLFAIAAAFLISAFRGRLKFFAPVLLPVALIFATMIPSAVDWLEHLRNPAAKPLFVMEFEQNLPDPLPWFVRVPDAAVAAVSNSSLEAIRGIDQYLSAAAALLIRTFDWAVTAVILLSGACALYRMLKSKIAVSDDTFSKLIANPQRRLSIVLLAWIIIPAVVAGVLLDRVNAGYFLGALPAGWLLPLALPRLTSGFRIAGRFITGALGLAGLGVVLLFLSLIAKHDIIPGTYYLTYAEQKRVVEYLNSEQISPDHVWHLSGDWYQHSYDYIYKYVVGFDAARSHTRTDRYALMEGKYLRPREPMRFQFFMKEKPVMFGDFGILFMPSRGAAEIFTRDYYGINER